MVDPAVPSLTRQLLSVYKIRPENVAAIGLSGHMHSIVPLRADGSARAQLHRLG